MRPKLIAPFVAIIFTLLPGLSLQAQQKPFTQEQVVNMVRDGFGDDSGTKLIEQRGIEFAPSDDFIQTLKTAGASEEFLNALRAAKPPETAKKPLNQVQVFALLMGGVPSHRVAMLVGERGTDFKPTDDYLQEVRLAGGEDELIGALKGARVTSVENIDPAFQARQTEARQHLARAGEFYRGKRYADAAGELRAALVLTPEDADLHDALGTLLGEEGDWDGEITEEREALRLNPNDEFAHINLGMALGVKGDWDGEVVEEREALRLNPKNATAHVNLGVALGGKHDLDGEIAEEREALRLEPNNEKAHLNLGAVLGDRGDLDGAIAEAHEALRVNPNNELAHSNLAHALGGKHDWDGEIAEEREVLRIDPNNEMAHVNLGMALGMKGDRDGEIAEERAAVGQNPNDEKAHVDLGLALGAKHDWDGAIEEFREALRLNPKNATAHASLGLVLGIKGDSDGAITEFRQALSLNPKDANAHYGLGLAFEKKGDQAGALEEFRSAYELNSDNGSYREAYERLLNSTTTTASSKEQHNWERGKVIAQDISSSPVGTYAAPVGTATVAVPIYRRSNSVVIETDNYRYEWNEVGRNMLILPANGFVDFYRDGNWFIVLDSKHKKHKFTLVSMTARRQEK